MPRDEWLDRWLDAQIHEIEKIDRCEKEHYATLLNRIHELEMDNISLSAEAQELRATIDNLTQDQTATTVQFTDMIRAVADSVLKHTTACPHPESWKLVWNRLRKLEDAENKREGSGKWEALIINAIITVIVSLTVAVLLYFATGGRITS